jgi:dTDP-4-dehydrorhamnose reductase
MTEPYPPAGIEDEAELDEVLTRPSPLLVEFIRSVSNPLVILGAGGKMGPTLAVRAKRAAQAANHELQVIAVSRFTDASARRWLERHGVATISADLLCRDELGKLPDSSNVVHLVGLKFGTQQNPSLTWAVNTIAPALVAERYANARVVALSTGNVYPLVPVDSGGATERCPLTPAGEYANAAVARERVFDYMARKNATQVALLRLNYAVELRYGVLLDIARQVHEGAVIDLATGYFNCIWQGDANEMILRSFALTACPPRPMNLTGADTLSVRDVAAQFAGHFGVTVRFTGAESPTALLSNTEPMRRALGVPATPWEIIIRWTAHWVAKGGRTLGKPTHFEVRDGRY